MSNHRWANKRFRESVCLLSLFAVLVVFNCYQHGYEYFQLHESKRIKPYANANVLPSHLALMKNNLNQTSESHKNVKHSNHSNNIYRNYRSNSGNFSYDIYIAWRNWWLQSEFTRIYINDKCHFIYFTTLKTASATTRAMIDLKQCGYGVKLVGNKRYWSTCGNHECNSNDLMKLNKSQQESNSLANGNDYFSMIFVRNPIERFESLYNYLSDASMNHLKQWRDPKSLHWNLPSIKKETDTVDDETVETFLQFVAYFSETVLNSIRPKKWLIKKSRKHFLPMHLSLCVNFNKKRARNKRTRFIAKQIANNSNDLTNRMDRASKMHPVQCFSPNPLFIGKVEHLKCDMSWIDNNRKLGNNAIDKNVYSKSHKTRNEKIEKGTLYKYEKALLIVCRLYWNDFVCFNYEIPQICLAENEKNWHLPLFCVNIANNQPMPIVPVDHDCFE